MGKAIANLSFMVTMSRPIGHSGLTDAVNLVITIT